MYDWFALMDNVGRAGVSLCPVARSASLGGFELVKLLYTWDLLTLSVSLPIILLF